MNVAHAEVAFRDRRLSDVFDLALRFLMVRAGAYGKLGAVVLVPCVALSYAAARSWGWIAGWTIAVGLALVAQAPFTVLASRLVFEREVRVRDVLVASLRDLPRIVLLRIADVIIVVFTSVVSFWVGSIFLFTTEVVLLERSSLGGAFSRSQRIATNATGDAMLALMSLAVLAVGATLLGHFTGNAIIHELLEGPAVSLEGGGSLLALLGLFTAVPYLATARFFTYLNVRTRVEGWDIQTRFAALVHRAAEEEEGEKR